jgi:adenylate cyclase
MSTEPRSISVLVADICGSSRLNEKLGEAEAQRAVERCLHRMERAAEAAKGRVIKTSGNELLAVFDSAEAATHASAEIQQRVDALPPVSGISLTIRIGFQYGEVSEEGDSISGDTVNVASQLAELAKAGQVLTTAATVGLLPDDLREQTRELDGVTVGDEAVPVCEVLWERDDDGSTMRFSATPPALKDTQLRLQNGEQEVWMDANRPHATLGRDAGATLITRDSRASRSHGRIERRRDKYVLVDESTNGTYLKFQGEPEVVLRHEEAILRGRGYIAFGHSVDDQDDELVEFEVVG